MILLIGAGIGLFTMFLVWCLYLKTQNPSIVDMFWSINIALIGSYYLLEGMHEIISYVAFIGLLLWSLRLASYLYITRVSAGEIDKRYETLSQNWNKKTLGFLVNYLFQGVLGWVIALPFYYITMKKEAGLEMVLASLLILIGIIGESLADIQLLSHKKKKSNTICEKGLWAYSRHPNYFFECVVWLGFSLMGISNVYSVFSFISVIMIFSIMWFITIPLTESGSLERRGESFKQYQRRVSIFIPWFSKTHS